jgi:hypothetical protein
VTVQHRWTEGFPIFKFECAEKEPLPPQWRLLQFKERDGVEVEFFTEMESDEGRGDPGIRIGRSAGKCEDWMRSETTGASDRKTIE